MSRGTGNRLWRLYGRPEPYEGKGVYTISCPCGVTIHTHASKVECYDCGREYKDGKEIRPSKPGSRGSAKQHGD